MATKTEEYPHQDVTSSSTITSTVEVEKSNTSSLASIRTKDSFNKRMNVATRKRIDTPAPSTIRVRVVDNAPQHLHGEDADRQFCDTKRIERMLADPMAPKDASVTSIESEFDWKDYNFQTGQSTIDPNLLDSNSDMEEWTPGTLERRYISRNFGKQIYGGPRDVYVYYSRNTGSRSSSNSVKSSGHIIKPEQIRGILKAKQESASETVEHHSENADSYAPSVVDTKDPYDISESVDAFNQYLQQRAVRFERNKSKRTKLRFLSRNLTIEKRAQWDKSPRTVSKQNKDDEEDGSKLPPLKVPAGTRAIQDFEKRNFVPTASKMITVESLFLKNTQTTSECDSSSDDEDAGEEDDDNDDDEDKETHVPDAAFKRINSVPLPTLEVKRQKVKRAMSLKGDEGIIPIRGGNQFKRAVKRVQRLITRKSFKSLCRDDVGDSEENDEQDIDLSPLERFRHAGRLVVILLRAVGIKPEKPEDGDYNFLSWTILYDELGISRLSYDSTGLTFDPQQFKANRESFLSLEVRDILLAPPSMRTDSQIQAVIRFLSQVVTAFGEYPLRIQRSTLKCCTYERFEPGRVIIRQGHRAENFYFILSGAAVVTIMDSGVDHVHTVNMLTSGNSFGELAFLNMSQRTATVTCREAMESLCVEREDFVKIFMRRFKDKEPEHVTFLKNVDVLKGWPIHKLPLDNLKICAFTYVRRGVTLCPDSAKSEWLFVIVSGTCKIIKALNDVSSPSEKVADSKSHGLSSIQNRFPRIMTFNSRSAMDKRGDKRYNTYSRMSKSSRQNNRCMSGIATVINRSEEEVKQSRSEHALQLENIYQRRHVLPTINQRQKKKHRGEAKANSDINNSLRMDGDQQRMVEDEEDDIEVEWGDKSDEVDDDSLTPKSDTPDSKLTPSSDTLTPMPKTPDIHVTAATPSQFLRPATQNFGIHRASLKPTTDGLAPLADVQRSWQKKKKQKRKVFIEVARLEPSDVFGLEHVVMGDMDDVTATSLVSDGAEVVIIEKKFFSKHLTEDIAKDIRKKIRPLPSVSVLQQNLLNQRHWDAYKSQTLETQAKHLIKTKLNHAFRV